MTEELVKKGLSILQNSAGLFTAEAEKTFAEYINLLLAFAILDLVKTLLIIFAVFVVIRKINVLIKAEEETSKDSELLKGLSVTKNLFAIGVSAYAIFGGMATVKEIVKITIAPRVYLIEKGTNLIKAPEQK